MKINHRKNKKYFKIKIYASGKVSTEELNGTNFHPSHVNQICSAIGDKDDYTFIVSDENNLSKNSWKLYNYLFKEFEKQNKILIKQENGLQKAFVKLKSIYSNEVKN